MIITDLIKYPQLNRMKKVAEKIQHTRMLTALLYQNSMITLEDYEAIQTVCDGCSVNLDVDVLAECEKPIPDDLGKKYENLIEEILEAARNEGPLKVPLTLIDPECVGLGVKSFKEMGTRHETDDCSDQ